MHIAIIYSRFAIELIYYIFRRLNYETRSVYRFVVIASRDLREVTPTVRFLESVEVEINVTDIDECRAEFEQPVYRVTLPIDSPVGRQVENFTILPQITMNKYNNQTW